MNASDPKSWWHVRPGYWFRPKLFGWGITPVTWAGWIVTIAFAALLIADISWVRPDALKIWLGIVLATGFTLLAWTRTDDAWRWRWGKEEE